MQALRGSILVVSLCLFTASAVGEGMQLRHLAGGVTNTLEIDGKYWFQGVGDRLLVLESRSGNMVPNYSFPVNVEAPFARIFL